MTSNNSQVTNSSLRIIYLVGRTLYVDFSTHTQSPGCKPDSKADGVSSEEFIFVLQQQWTFPT